MKSKFYSISILVLASFIHSTVVEAQCPVSCTYTSPSGGSNFNMNGNETLCITGNVTNLNINFNGTGNVICVAPGATWTQTNDMSLSGVTINIYGTLEMNATNITANSPVEFHVQIGGVMNTNTNQYGSNFTIVNEGDLNFTATSQVTFQGTLNNFASGDVVATAPSLFLFLAATVTNDGIMTFGELENTESPSMVNTANGVINVNGSFYNHGEFTNNGSVFMDCSLPGSLCGFRVGDKGPGKEFINNSCCFEVTGDVQFDGVSTNNGKINIINGDLNINKAHTGTNGHIIMTNGDNYWHSHL